jgi:molybdopterin synthase sulfur carrier subunit
MIQVLFFGPVADRVGQSALSVDYQPNLRLQDVRDTLAARYPQAFTLVCMTAVNGQHVRDGSMLLPDHSEVTFMAKFSGG